METQVMRIRVSPEVLKTIIHDVQYSGETFGVYSSMTQTLTGGTNHTSLLTGLTVPILLIQNTVDLGYYSVFDGAVSQQNVVPISYFHLRLPTHIHGMFIILQILNSIHSYNYQVIL